MAAGLGIGWGINWGSITLAANAVLDYLTFKLNFNTIATDFTFTRNSFATRVNEFGLIETVTDLGSDLVQNGSFDELGSEQVTNGDFENGTTDWDFGGDWTLVNGTAEILTSTNSFLIQSNIIPLTVKTYKIQYEVVSTNGSNFRFAGGNSAFGSVNLDSATVGVKTVYLQSNGTKTNLQFNQNAFRGSIDNVSVKQVDPNDEWTIEALWTIQDGVASGNGATGSNEELNQNISSSGILAGSTVRCSFEIKNYVSGSVQVIGISNTVSRSSNGIYEFQGELTSFNIRFRGTTFNGDVTNLLIQEVLEDDVPRIDYTGSTFDVPVLGSELVTNGDFATDSNWSKQSGWSIANGVATFDINNYSGGNANIYQNCMVSGKEYVLTYDVVDYVQGFVRNVSRSGTISRTANGTYTEQFIATNSNLFLKADSGTNTILSIDNVSVKEVTAYTTTDKGAFLLEPISTNLAIYSEDASQGILSNCTVQSGFISPEGNLTAYKLIEDSSNSIKLFRAVNNSASTINTSYSSSIFVKKGERTKVRVYGYHLTNQYFYVDYDLTDNSYLGSFGQNSQVDGYAIEDIGDNGWKRITIIGQKNATYSWDVGVSPLNDNGDVSYLGNGTSGLYIWGAQMEELSYATSYIPTNGTTVTRAQESSVKNNVNGLFDDNVGSIYLAYDGVLTSGTTLNNMNPFRLYGQGSNRIRLYYSPDADFLGSSVDFENGGKIAWSCNGTTILTYINGALVDTHTITSNFTTLTNFILSTPFMTHRINDIKIYDKALTDAQLIELTTI